MTMDLDAFFASCEELRHPEVKGIPMVVGYELNGRGIVSTANYAAREKGIKSGMPLFKARALFEQVKIITPDHTFYQEKANEVFNIIKSYSDKIEIASIDECFVDLTKMTNKYSPLQIAKLIKNDIKKNTGLTISIGISTDVLLSKMASGMDKPNGITTLWKNELPKKLWPLNIGEMYMIGSKLTIKFNELGIKTIGDLANLKDNRELYFKTRKNIGVVLDRLIAEANGEVFREIDVRTNELKSLSREETFGISLYTLEAVNREMRKLLEYCFERMTKRKVGANSIHIMIKVDKSFTRLSSTRRYDRRNNNWDYVWTLAYDIMEKLFIEGMSIKQVGVGFSGLKENERSYTQLTLDDQEKKVNVDKIQKIIDEASTIIHNDVFLGSTMNENFRYNKKRLVDGDRVKFKRSEDDKK